MGWLIALAVIIVLNCSVTLGYTAPVVDHGIGGTLNLDYFNPSNDPQIRWLIKDQESNHLIPAKGFLLAGRYGRAIDELRFLLDRFVNHPHGLMVLGAVAKLTKNYALAIQYYEKAIRIYPQYAVTHAQYGAYLVDIGKITEGIEQLRKAVEINPQLAAAHGWLAKAYYKSGNLERARQTAERAKALGYSDIKR
jgi:tetratricopeptide (TPR) repeat protein